MRILLSNNHLEKVGGTENYTYALAVELLRRGHKVEYFTFHKGEISDKLEELGVKYMSRKSYDLILANHRSTVRRLCYKGHIIQTCHGVFHILEQPSRTADALVAVTNEIADHLRHLGRKSQVILNGVDCRRFYPQTPLSPKLQTVLSLCQSDKANAVIEACCNRLGLELIKCNKHVDNLWEIEKLINRADLVIGIGRSLYDAMACGRCVISYDHRAYMLTGMGDGYLTPSNIDESIYCNCSGRGKCGRMTESMLMEELAKYNPEDGERNRQYALDNLNIEKAVDAYLAYAAQSRLIKSSRKKMLKKLSKLKYSSQDK